MRPAATRARLRHPIPEENRMATATWNGVVIAEAANDDMVIVENNR
jgi:uncharacterized protein (DUF427 family)